MHEREELRRRLVLTAIAFEGGLAVVAWLLGRFLARPPLDQIQWTLGAVGWAAAATVPLVVVLWLITRFPLGPLKRLKRFVYRFIVPMFRDCRLTDFALISLVAGVGEEMLFRGAVQEGIWELSGSWWLALAGASLLFGLVHPITATYAVGAALIGLYLGGLWWVSGNLLVPMLTHAFYDFCALIYLVRRRT